MKEKYFLIISMFFMNSLFFAQGVTFPVSPTQAPIGGLGLLAIGGAVIAYRRFKK